MDSFATGGIAINTRAGSGLGQTSLSPLGLGRLLLGLLGGLVLLRAEALLPRVLAQEVGGLVHLPGMLWSDFAGQAG